MHIWAEYEEEEDIAKRYLQDQYTTMVKEGKEITDDKGEEERTE